MENTESKSKIWDILCMLTYMEQGDYRDEKLQSDIAIIDEMLKPDGLYVGDEKQFIEEIITETKDDTVGKPGEIYSRNMDNLGQHTAMEKIKENFYTPMVSAQAAGGKKRRRSRKKSRK